VSNVETMIDLPQVEARINEQVTTTVMANSDVQAAVDDALTSAQTQLVSSDPVEFTLGQAKNLVREGTRDGVPGQVRQLLPDDVGVTMLTPADVPQIYSAVDPEVGLVVADTALPRHAG
jgi:hypothetical protein